MSASIDHFFQRLWYDGQSRWLSTLLLPLSWLFGLIAALRRGAYRIGLLRTERLARPVIVIGNITVGGSGKTPVTIWLARELQRRGLRVGIVLRGYGGRSGHWPRDVEKDTGWDEVGDEATLLAQRTGAIVVAGPDRVADARRAIQRGAQIVLSDDGLQHYRLGRDCEIAVIDGARGLGNARLLPAGPLREPRGRLSDVDLRIVTLRAAEPAASARGIEGAVTVVARLRDAVSIATGERRALGNFKGARVHAVAGIGHPRAFFDALADLGLDIEEHPRPDHARLSAADISFADGAAVLMTQKDAVKCRAIADDRHWAVPMEIETSDRHAATVAALLDRILSS